MVGSRGQPQTADDHRLRAVQPGQAAAGFRRQLGGVLAVRFGDRLGKGIRTAPRDALLADSTPAEQRGLAFGIHRAGDSLGAVAGDGVALLIVVDAGNEAALSRATFQRIALVSAIPAFLAVLVLIAGLSEKRRVAPAAGQPILVSLGDMPAPFRRFLLIFALFTLGNSADAFVVLRAQERGLSVAGVLAMLMVFNLVYAGVAGRRGDCRTGGAAAPHPGWLGGLCGHLSGAGRGRGGLAGGGPVHRLWPLPRPGGGQRPRLCGRPGRRGVQRGRPTASITPWSAL